MSNDLEDFFRGPPSRGRKTQDEQAFLRQMRGYLEAQGTFDESDLGNIREFVSTEGRSLEEDWSDVISALRNQDEEELADEVESSGRPDFTHLAEKVRSSGKDNKWAIFVGAGGSRPSPTDIPTVAELLPRLWQKAEEINAPSLLRLKERCAQLNITNIEDLLTAIDLAQSAASNPPIASLLEDLLYTQIPPTVRTRRGSPVRLVGSELVDSLSESSQLLFSVLVGMMKDQKENDIHRAIASRVNGKDDVIITTNYDVCIERALGPGNYFYGLDGNITKKSNETRLIKLHGSLSWYVCKSCDTYVTAGLDELDAASASKLYPLVAMCHICAATAQQLIVPPVGAKSADHPALLENRQGAEEAFADAPVIIVIGYSFSETDHYNNADDRPGSQQGSVEARHGF